MMIEIMYVDSTIKELRKNRGTTCAQSKTSGHVIKKPSEKYTWVFCKFQLKSCSCQITSNKLVVNI